MLRHVTGIWKFRYFLLALVGLDLRRRYRRSFIGTGWSLLQPIAMAFVLVGVFSTILNVDREQYTKTLLLGMAVWNFLRESAVSGCQAIIAHEAYIRQSPLPFALYPLRLVLGQAIHSLIALGVALAAVVIVDGNFENIGVLWSVVPALFLLLLAGWAFATIFAFANVYFQDTQHLLEVVTQLLFFLTPIIYPAEVLVNKGLGWMAKINPANQYLELIRAPLATGQLPSLKLYLYASIVTVGLMFIAATVIASFQKKVIFRL